MIASLLLIWLAGLVAWERRRTPPVPNALNARRLANVLRGSIHALPPRERLQLPRW